MPHRESEAKELSMVLTHLSWRQMKGCVGGRSRQHSLTPEASTWESQSDWENEGMGRVDRPPEGSQKGWLGSGREAEDPSKERMQ